MSLTSVAGNITLASSANDIGANTAAAAGANLAAISLNASGSSTISVADGDNFYLDNASDDTIDLSSTITAVTATGSTINTGTFNNLYGNTTLVASSNAGTLDVEGITGVDVTMTTGGAGGATIGTVTATGDLVLTSSGAGAVTATALGGSTTDSFTATITNSGNVNLGAIDTQASGAATIDASGMGGELTVNLGLVSGTATVTTGAGGVTGITSSQAGTTNITFGAANAVNDHVVMNATEAGYITIANFSTAAANFDTVDTDVVGVEAAATAAIAGTTDLVALNGTTSLAATDTVSLKTVTAATTVTVADTILVISGDVATEDLVETALEAAGSHALTITMAADDAFLVAWDDGSNSYLGYANSENIVSAATIVSGDLTVNTLVTLTGVSDVTDVTAAMWGTALV